jgi:branched-chain amino acid transport system ATP-binding protein
LALLELAGVDAGYGRAQVLFDAGLSLEAGEVVMLAGRNGAGKSTTLKAVMGLVARSGEISFNGRRVDALEPFEIARLGIGYVPEDRRIFGGLTVAQNLAVGRRPGRPGLPEWTEEKLFALFPSLAPMRERPGARMSGGEQKMLAIARTIIGNPRAILLDEPSEGLAPIVVRQMAAAIAELKQAGLAVLLCEQNARFGEAIVDRIYRIERGQIRAS